MRKPKIKSEAETRKNILGLARNLGCDIEVRKIFERYDKLLKNCTNETERYQISVMGAAELHRFLDCRGALVINGQEILPADPDFKPDNDS